jgi:multidrug efflux pump subunit AcrA (membrane-fusion protein)
MRLPRISTGWLWAIGLLLISIGAFASRDVWWDRARSFVQSSIARQRAALAEEHHEGEHSGDEHSHAGHAHDDAASIELSPQAQANLGLTPQFLPRIELQSYRRTITIPGIVVERPGRTSVQVSTPIHGVITHVHAVEGEAVQPGTLLFQIRITAEALISTQTELLKTVGELDVENREIVRLTKVTESGAVPQKTLLERQYAKEKLESHLNAHREALRLLGLADRQIEDIVTNRRLLSELQIVAPHPDDHSAHELKLTDRPVQPGEVQPPPLAIEPPAEIPVPAPPLVLQEVRIHKGQTVAAGETLAIMSDLSDLYIEGQAFEQDIQMLTDAAAKGWKLSAIIAEPNNQRRVIENLDLVYSSSAIHPDSRTLHFFARLPNEVVRNVEAPTGQRFVDWKYRLGQRLQLRVPVEEWTDQFVLPIDAVAREGAESFVFRKYLGHFDRIPVLVKYRDSQNIVVANDGALQPGYKIAFRGAHQIQMALKNKSGGGVDPHAGHNH